MRRLQQCSTSSMLSKACWYSWCSSVSHVPWSSYRRGTKTGDPSKWFPITTWEDLGAKFKCRLYHRSSECAPGTRLERWDGEAKFEWTDWRHIMQGVMSKEGVIERCGFEIERVSSRDVTREESPHNEEGKNVPECGLLVHNYEMICKLWLEFIHFWRSAPLSPTPPSPHSLAIYICSHLHHLH